MHAKNQRKRLPKLLAVVGPTASGKTDLAIALAREFGGEIVSADSRQLYRGMAIGTDVAAGAWEKREEGRVYVAGGVVHHLLACYSPAKPLTLAQYRRAALRKISGIIRRGKLPILAGGTGLYVQAIVDNFTVPPVPPSAAFRSAAESRPTGELFAELQKKDPAYAARIDPQNRRYIVRALEVIAETGLPFSQQQKKAAPQFDALLLGVSRQKEEADAAIARRVAAQFERGLEAEVRRLAGRYGWDGPPMDGLGYRQLRGWIEGRETKEAAAQRVIHETRQFAKRQRTWWKRDGRIVWVRNAEEARRAVAGFLA